MESFSVDSEVGKQLESPKQRRKGGFITLPCIIANESFEKVSSYGIQPNMIFYLMQDYNMTISKATHVLFLWSAGTNFTPIVGAFLADSYLGRFLTVAVGSVISLLGLILLWLTAMVPKLSPPPCNTNIIDSPCESPTPSQYGFLVSALALMSVGAGGIRSASIAFGADQVKSNDKRALEIYFSWYYVSATVSTLIAVTAIVFIQNKMGWKVGYGIPAILMFISAFSFLVASPFYFKRPIGGSILTELAQVIVAAIKNRRLTLPPPDSAQYHVKKGSKNKEPTDRLRFLNKACIIKSPEDVKSDGVASNPWKLCTVDQVESLKTIIRIIPLWTTGIMQQIVGSQFYPTLQAQTMDRRIFSSLKIPAGSLIVILMISLTGWMLVYDRILIPLASKIKGKQVILAPKTRLGLGLFIAFIGSIIAAVVEHARRKKAIEQGFQNDPQAVIDMSVKWLFPQFVCYGIADAFNTIGQIEFYYAEFPKTMSSIATSLLQLCLAAAYLLASALLSLVEKYTGGNGKESWTSNNINKGHIDYYYWLLSILCAVNFVYFLFCSWAYGPSNKNNTMQDADEVQESKVQGGEPILPKGSSI